MTTEQWHSYLLCVYYPTAEWNSLFEAYNKKNGTNLNQYSLNDNVTLLKAIAKKNNIQFKGNEYQAYSSINKIFNDKLSPRQEKNLIHTPWARF